MSQICVGAPFSRNTFTALCVIAAVLLLGRKTMLVIVPAVIDSGRPGRATRTQIVSVRLSPNTRPGNGDRDRVISVSSSPLVIRLRT